MINQARAKLGLKKWKYSKGTQKLALEISKEYVANKKTIATGHYVPGIVRATNRVGLKLPGNYNCVEDMAGFKDGSQVTMAAEAGQLELNAFEPVVFYQLFESFTALTGAVDTLVENCITGITANKGRCKQLKEGSVGIATVLCPYLGY